MGGPFIFFSDSEKNIQMNIPNSDLTLPNNHIGLPNSHQALPKCYYTLSNNQLRIYKGCVTFYVY